MSLTWRYRLKVAVGAVSAVMCVVTLAWQDWIETVFRVDPDQRSGWLEWLIVGVFAAVAIVGGLLARADWRWIQRVRAESSPGVPL